MTKEEIINITLEEIGREKGLRGFEVKHSDLINRLAEKLVNKTNDIHNVSCCEHHDAYVVDQYHRKCRDCGKELYNKDYS